MRNFYTVLDYEHNLIMIGVNKGSSETAKAELIGKKYKPFHYKSLKKGGSVALVLCVFLVLFAIAVAFFVKAKKEQKKPIHK